MINTGHWNKHGWVKVCALTTVLILGFVQREASAQAADVSMGVAFVNARGSAVGRGERRFFQE